MQSVFIISIIDVVGFSLTALAGIIGLSSSSIVDNKLFFRTFYCLIILISALQITIGVINFTHSSNTNQLLFVEQIINNFSLLVQLAIMLTIAYGWSVISCKLREEQIQVTRKLTHKRYVYIILIVIMLVVLSMATAGVVVYSLRENTTLPVIIDVSEIVMQVAMIVGCFLQFYQGRQLSQLINQYKRVIGIKFSKMRFNMVYIVAFVVVLLRSLVELGRLIYELTQGFPIVSFWHSLEYFILYTVFELIPLAMYLIGIKVRKEETTESTIRESILSRSSDTSSRRDTQLIYRA